MVQRKVSKPAYSFYRVIENMVIQSSPVLWGFSRGDNKNVKYGAVLEAFWGTINDCSFT